MQERCKCCGRILREHERYCEFCGNDCYCKVKQKPALSVKTVQAYCVKGKAKISVKNPKDYLMKNKRLAVRGICPDCGTKVFKIKGMARKLKLLD